jgi:pyruvate,water dikinase
MRSLWQGLATDKAFWSQGLPHMDWEEFDRISRGVFSRDTRLLASYAVLSGDYLHLMVRFGYHFSVLDSVCGQEANANYANFQFRGGGGSFEQRVLRLEFIKRVLARCGFSIETKGDLLNAAYARDGLQGTAAKLTVLGALMAETRLMDMGLARHSQVEEAEKRFLADHGTGDKGHGQA